MRRKLYFWLERLEIKRSERIAVTLLLCFIACLSGILAMIEPSPNYEEDHYQKLEKIFREKSEAFQREESVIMARYEPDGEILNSKREKAYSNNTINSINPSDTTRKKDRPVSTVDLININMATSEQLQKLPGIGPAYASRIVAWREKNGSFTSKNQLLEIKGIGDKRLARIKPLITLE